MESSTFKRWLEAYGRAWIGQNPLDPFQIQDTFQSPDDALISSRRWIVEVAH